MTGERAILTVGETCWRIEPARRFRFIVDAADYFVAARKAMLSARRSILLIGWDFDPRIRIGDAEDGGPECLGDFILWLADRTPGLEIRLLRWDTGALKAMFRGNSILSILRWKMHPRITLRLDAAHPVASAHHQKIIVIDDSLAFCGGIDMTVDRWDTRAHLDDNPDRIEPDGSPYGPWHDATSLFDGPAARAMGDLARTRWQAATGEILPPCKEQHDCWPEGLEPGLADAQLGIARTIPAMDGQHPVHEIEAAYVAMIAMARRHIYVESQYFASRRIARAIAERLVEPDGPEIVIVNPVESEGWLEPLAMDTARARLFEALKKLDTQDRFRIYHPRTARGAPIHVHAKVMVVDDRLLRVGSSNLNNRSLRLDTECDVILSAGLPGQEHLAPAIEALRDDLLAEHLYVPAGTVSSKVKATGSLIATIDALRGEGHSLHPYRLPELSALSEWLADNEILDPNGPEDLFEHPDRRGLFKGWGRLRARFRRHRRH